MMVTDADGELAATRSKMNLLLSYGGLPGLNEQEAARYDRLAARERQLLAARPVGHASWASQSQP
jgi:hypothetical protein